MEGDGPIMGHAEGLRRDRHWVGDAVAVDASAARVMGLRTKRVRYLAETARFLGHVDAARIPMRGQALERFVTPFEVLPEFAALRT